jgi:hypothetical protein
MPVKCSTQAGGTCCNTHHHSPKQHVQLQACTGHPSAPTVGGIQRTVPRPTNVFLTCRGLVACALHCPVACGLALSCDWPSTGAASAVAHRARHRAAATIKAAVCRGLGTASAYCSEGDRHTHIANHVILSCASTDHLHPSRTFARSLQGPGKARQGKARCTVHSLNTISAPVWSWAHVPCTVQLPVASHVAVIGPPPVLHVPLHTVPATELLPQSKLPLVGASGLPVHTARKESHTSTQQ